MQNRITASGRSEWELVRIEYPQRNIEGERLEHSSEWILCEKIMC